MRINNKGYLNLNS